MVARQRQAVGRRLAKRRPVGCALGVLWNDLPLWDPDRARREQGVSWVEALLDLPAGSPGRERMREGLACAGVGEGELLAEIASRHYRDVSRFAARYAPGLASGGDVLSLHDTPDSVFRVIARFVDFVSVQMGPACSPRPGPGYEAEWNPDRLWRLHHLTGKPVLVADHAVSFPDARGRDTLWHCMPGPAAAGDVYRRFVVGCATLPFVVGYCRCGFRDRYVEGRKLVKQGLLDESGAPHRKLVDRVVEANREACSAFSRR